MCDQNQVEGLFSCQISGPYRRVSDSTSLKWDLKTCISNKFPGSDAAGLENAVGTTGLV